MAPRIFLGAVLFYPYLLQDCDSRHLDRSGSGVEGSSVGVRAR